MVRGEGGGCSTMQYLDFLRLQHCAAAVDMVSVLLSLLFQNILRKPQCRCLFVNHAHSVRSIFFENFSRICREFLQKVFRIFFNSFCDYIIFIAKIHCMIQMKTINPNQPMGGGGLSGPTTNFVHCYPLHFSPPQTL